jgi:hypothetical protein
MGSKSTDKKSSKKVEKVEKKVEKVEKAAPVKVCTR